MKEGDASGRGRVPVKVKKDRGRTASSRAWLKRHGPLDHGHSVNL